MNEPEKGKDQFDLSKLEVNPDRYVSSCAELLTSPNVIALFKPIASANISASYPEQMMVYRSRLPERISALCALPDTVSVTEFGAELKKTADNDPGKVAFEMSYVTDSSQQVITFNEGQLSFTNSTVNGIRSNYKMHDAPGTEPSHCSLVHLMSAFNRSLNYEDADPTADCDSFGIEGLYPRLDCIMDSIAHCGGHYRCYLDVPVILNDEEAVKFNVDILNQCGEVSYNVNAQVAKQRDEETCWVYEVLSINNSGDLGLIKNPGLTLVARYIIKDKVRNFKGDSDIKSIDAFELITRESHTENWESITKQLLEIIEKSIEEAAKKWI